jgi:hypothetical protein
MLPFGSITSLVPLSILAFAYLVYLSVSVLNKNIPESSKTIRQSEISVSSDSDNNYQVLIPISDIIIMIRMTMLFFLVIFISGITR